MAIQNIEVVHKHLSNKRCFAHGVVTESKSGCKMNLDKHLVYVAEDTWIFFHLIWNPLPFTAFAVTSEHRDRLILASVTQTILNLRQSVQLAFEVAINWMGPF